MNELPRGAVTFVFTDIEGSTQLVRALRDRYPEVLAEHQRLLRESFGRHGGHEIDTQGDAFFYAFPSAHDAVLAAIEGQRAVSGYPWPNGAPVKVRMGIHTGQSAPVDGRYTGLAVHRAARICAAGHGGQVLISQATQSLLEDEEEDLEVGLRDLGEQRLKDIGRPVRVYQVAAAGLSAEFPPLRQEAEPTELAAPPPVPLYRRPLVLGGAAFVAAGVLIGAILLVTRSGDAGGLSGVKVNHAGVIDPETNLIIAEVPVGIRPGPVAVGSNAVWVGNDENDRTLTKIDPRTRAPAGTIPLGGRTPTGIAVGLGGVWVAHGLLGSVTRVDPEFGQPTDTLEAGGGGTEGSVAIGGGSVWAVFGNSTLVRIDPAGPRIAGTGFAGSTPTGIVVAEGDVWVANGGEATVVRFNPSTFEGGDEIARASVGRRPSGIAFGEGSLWVTSAADDRVYRIDPATTGVIDTIDVGNAPAAVAVGGGGVWVANGGDGTVSRIDPNTNAVVATIETGNLPAGLAVGEGSVWVTVQAR